MTTTIVLVLGILCIFVGAALGLRAAADASIERETREAIAFAAREDNRLRAEAVAKAYDEMELARIFDEGGFGVLPVVETTEQIECCLANMGRADGTGGQDRESYSDDQDRDGYVPCPQGC